MNQQINIYTPDPEQKRRIAQAATKAGFPSVSKFLLTLYEMFEEEQKEKENK